MFHSKLLNYRKEFYVTHKESCPKNTGGSGDHQRLLVGTQFFPVIGSTETETRGSWGKFRTTIPGANIVCKVTERKPLPNAKSPSHQVLAVSAARGAQSQADLRRNLEGTQRIKSFTLGNLNQLKSLQHFWSLWVNHRTDHGFQLTSIENQDLVVSPSCNSHVPRFFLHPLY